MPPPYWSIVPHCHAESWGEWVDKHPQWRHGNDGPLPAEEAGWVNWLYGACFLQQDGTYGSNYWIWMRERPHSYLLLASVPIWCAGHLYAPATHHSLATPRLHPMSNASQHLSVDLVPRTDSNWPIWLRTSAGSHLVPILLRSKLHASSCRIVEWAYLCWAEGGWRRVWGVAWGKGCSTWPIWCCSWVASSIYCPKPPWCHYERCCPGGPSPSVRALAPAQC